MTQNQSGQRTLLTFVTSKEIGSSLIADALNIRFSAFLVKVAEHYDLNGNTFFSEMRELLEKADIPQEA